MPLAPVGCPSARLLPTPNPLQLQGGGCLGISILAGPSASRVPCRGRLPGDARGGPGASASGLRTGSGEIAGERKTSSWKRRGLPGSTWGGPMSLQAWLPADPELGVPEA